MSDIEKLALEVRHVTAFLQSAESALSSGGKDRSRIDAAGIGIEAANEAMAHLMGTLKAARAST